MAGKQTNPDQVIVLKKQVVELKAKVATLQKQLDVSQTAQKKKTKSRSGWPWRSISVWTCVVLATALLVAGNIFFWVGTSIVNTNRYVSVVGPLIDQPPIQSAVAQYTTTQLFKSVDVQSRIEQVLPPKADFLAPQLTSQLKSRTQSQLQTILASDKFHDVWYASITKSHQALISFSKTYEGNGTIVVSDVYSQLGKRLSNTKLSFLSDKTLPPKVGSIQLTTVGWLPALHKISKNLTLFKLTTLLLLLIFVVLAIWLTPKRRKTIIRLSLAGAILMLFTLIATKIAGTIVVDNVASTYQAAAQAAYNTVLHSFVTQTSIIMSLSLLVAVIAWLSGPYKPAVAIRKKTNSYRKALSAKLSKN